MSKQNEREREGLAVYDEATDPNYQYRWSYAEQRAYEGTRDRRLKKRGAVIYAVTLAVAFLCCFAILGGVLAIYQPYEPIGESGSIADVAEAVLPSTVLITGVTSEGYSYGTGFFVRQDGYIVTNYHVVAEQAQILVVPYGASQTYEASLVGYSAADDLAVLRIQGGGYPVVTLGSSDALRVGDVAIAVGNPTGPGGAWTTTSGIISSVDRTVTVSAFGMIIDMHMLQTDAALNSGNSGGPLCNESGEVIGIVTRKFNDSEGIGLAVPINGAIPLINAIMQTGSTKGVTSTVSQSRPMLGITATDVVRGESFTATATSSYLPQQKTFVAARDGIAVLTIDSTVPASKSLQLGDVIYAVDGKSCTTLAEMTRLLYQYELGDSVTLSISRNGKDITVKCHFVAP